MAVLKVTNYVTITQDGKKLHNALNFTLNKGDILWIRGVNGSGKTSFLKTLMKHYKRHTGDIDMNIHLDQIAYLPQVTQPHFFIPMHLHDLLEKKDFSLLPDEQLHHGWNVASGGERQKTLLIKIFNQSAELYLLDEPTNQMDQQGRLLLKEKLEQVVSQKQKAVLMICHDENFMSSLPYKELNLETYEA